MLGARRTNPSHSRLKGRKAKAKGKGKIKGEEEEEGGQMNNFYQHKSTI